ncbi:hypothetical protein BKA57DRAFT_443925 [Linnemannia elongata]|nr:hypothetical protein BKA57DRAFT_443925 [Linnemannia elongata]
MCKARDIRLLTLCAAAFAAWSASSLPWMLLCPLIQATSTPPGRDSTTCHSTAQIPAYVLLNRFLGKASRRFFTRRWYWSTTDSLSNLTTMSCSGGADKTATSRPMSSDLAEEA